MRTDADIIIPITAANPLLLALATVCLRTCRSTTDANIWAFINNTPDKSIQERLWDECKLLRIEYHPVDGPFSMSYTWNLGTDLSSARGEPYILYSGMDVIFYHGWLDNLLEAWEQSPQYWTVWPFWFDTRDFGTSCRRQTQPVKVLIPSHNPCGALLALKRSYNFRWDETFQEWEMDADLLYHMARHSLTGACCLNSRVDHLVETVRDNIDFKAHYGMERDDLRRKATARLKEKWHL